MIGQADTAVPESAGAVGFTKSQLTRALLLAVALLVLYAVVRRFVSSDAVALGLATACLIGYGTALALVQRRADVLTLLSAIGVSLACLVPLLTDGGSLPVKPNEAFVTFPLGLLCSPRC